MYTTTNYGFNIVEGTDMVNPLTQLNPNFTTLDTDLKAVSDNTVDSATCIKTGTVHAITRTNADANIFRFTATGNWNTGDTMTVDGAVVSVYAPDGTAPADGCFVINTEVLAAIQGTRVTLYINKYLPTAAQIEYSPGVSVKDELDNINNVKYVDITIPSATYITDSWSRIDLTNLIFNVLGYSIDASKVVSVMLTDNIDFHCVGTFATRIWLYCHNGQTISLACRVFYIE